MTVDVIKTALYRLYDHRKRFIELKKLNPPEVLLQKMASSEVKHLNALAKMGLTHEAVEKALVDNWLVFEGHGIKIDKLLRCLTHKATVQARVKAGVDKWHPKLFGCDLHTDCLECDCFVEATEEQQSRFEIGCDVFTGEKIPAFSVEDEEVGDD